MVIDFNSIKVRLNQSDNLFYMLANLAFQFHKGTIKPLSAQRETLSVKYFNSIKVRLNPLFVTILSRGYHNFNSIKVRLNLSGCLSVVAWFIFQFHKGTIKPEDITVSQLLSFNFNSIKVRLNRKTRISILINQRYFNSIKVRLNL